SKSVVWVPLVAQPMASVSSAIAPMILKRLNGCFIIFLSSVLPVVRFVVREEEHNRGIRPSFALWDFGLIEGRPPCRPINPTSNARCPIAERFRERCFG